MIVTSTLTVENGQETGASGEGLGSGSGLGLNDTSSGLVPTLNETSPGFSVSSSDDGKMYPAVASSGCSALAQLSQTKLLAPFLLTTLHQKARTSTWGSSVGCRQAGVVSAGCPA